MPPDEAVEVSIIEPTRVKNFAQFFKNYMSIWSVVVAALPIPITAFELIPVFNVQKESLSTYTTLFCFLLLGYIFYSRHKMAKYFFPYYFERSLLKNAEGTTALDKVHRRMKGIKMSAYLVNSLPLVLILASLASAMYYHSLFDSILKANPGLRRDALLLGDARMDGWVTALLMGSYLAIFIFAEAAFILMAIKEYLQDLLKISDTALIVNEYDSVESKDQGL